MHKIIHYGLNELEINVMTKVVKNDFMVYQLINDLDAVTNNNQQVQIVPFEGILEKEQTLLREAIVVISDNKNFLESVRAFNYNICLIHKEYRERIKYKYALRRNFSVEDLSKLLTYRLNLDTEMEFCESRHLRTMSGVLELDNNIRAIEGTVAEITKPLVAVYDMTTILRVRSALSEIITNAIEHGNLHITSKEKATSIDANKLQELYRQRAEQYKDLKVQIEFSITPEIAQYTISDQGEGFDYKRHIEKMLSSPPLELLMHGRGILMSQKYFDTITYNKKGNKVTLVKYNKHGFHNYK